MERGEEIESIQIDEIPLILKIGINELREFLGHRGAVHDLDIKIGSIVGKACYRGFTSCLFSHLETMKGRQPADLDRLFLSNPIDYITAISNVKMGLTRNPECARCINIQEKEMEGALSVLTEDSIIKRGIVEKDSLQNGKGRVSYDLLNQSLLDVALSKLLQNQNLKCGKVIDRYFLANSTIIEVYVSRIDGQNEQLYELAFHLPFTDEFMQILRRDVEQDLENDQTLLNMEKLDELLNRIVEITRKRVNHSIELGNKNDCDLIVLMTSFSVLGLGKLFPVLMDEDIEEIFLDSPDGMMYIHHVRHLHCRTKISLTTTDIQRVISRLRLETDKNLNDVSPSLKCVIKNGYFYTRFNVDVKPLNPLGFSLDIRRLNKKVFDIIDLIHLETFDIDIAAFLVFCLHARLNITIIGKTDTGKTTLLNALDMLYPQHLRKIYVEDEIETLTQDPAHYHQLKFKATTKERKSELIRNLLHRSPEVLILGEILTREETEAMFHCLSTGMRGLQTIHANTTASFIRRLRIHFNISINCFADLDFIILLNKYESGKRRMMEIAEFATSNEGEHLNTRTLTAYDPDLGGWSVLKIGESSVMNNFFARTSFNRALFNEYLEAVKMVIAKSIKRDRHETQELVKEFNQVYMSYRDYF